MTRQSLIFSPADMAKRIKHCNFPYKSLPFSLGVLQGVFLRPHPTRCPNAPCHASFSTTHRLQSELSCYRTNAIWWRARYNNVPVENNNEIMASAPKDHNYSLDSLLSTMLNHNTYKLENFSLVTTLLGITKNKKIDPGTLTCTQQH